jgi:hypothetical protein
VVVQSPLNCEINGEMVSVVVARWLKGIVLLLFLIVDNPRCQNLAAWRLEIPFMTGKCIYINRGAGTKISKIAIFVVVKFTLVIFWIHARVVEACRNALLLSVVCRRFTPSFKGRKWECRSCGVPNPCQT